MNITGGRYNRQKITAPDEHITRPTLSKVRMGVFNTLSSIMDFEEKSFLDMYAGSGIMGLEAISRGFSKLTAIEYNKKVYSIIKKNFSKYEKENDIKLFLGDSQKVCTKLTDKFDVIYIDPPYFSGVYEKSLDSVKHLTSGIIILEHTLNLADSVNADTILLSDEFEIIKQKKYADKFITFLKYNN